VLEQKVRCPPDSGYCHFALSPDGVCKPLKSKVFAPRRMQMAHLRQEETWDCGLACLLMVLR
jgi:hypothetical protein